MTASRNRRLRASHHADRGDTAHVQGVLLVRPARAHHLQPLPPPDPGGARGRATADRAEIFMREHVYEGRDFVIEALRGGQGMGERSRRAAPRWRPGRRDGEPAGRPVLRPTPRGLWRGGHQGRAAGQGRPHEGVGPAPQGGKTLWWPIIARNKKSVTLNLREEEGQELARRLVAEADVLVENFRPGTMERWGLGYDALARSTPAS